jgi:hypothetical protein
VCFVQFGCGHTVTRSCRCLCAFFRAPLLTAYAIGRDVGDSKTFDVQMELGNFSEALKT